MCGIVGISGGNLDRLIFSNSLLAHRGPDDSGIFTDAAKSIGLGHRRLSIVDLTPSGHQPMMGLDGQIVLVFNGEIYNFRELRAGLEAKGITFLGHSDTEVLLNLYLTEGESMLTKLNGIFAFALWDSRKEALLIARDALGVKPLYFTTERGRFAFASEIKSLMELAPEFREIDMVSIHRYLSFLSCPGEGTPIKGMYKLPPGEALWVRRGCIERHWKWYQLPTFGASSAVLDKASALAGLREHLRQAVTRQMVADVPVGAFLSGGLDSSAIVVFAREQNPNIRCFTIENVGGQENGVVDDLPYARKVAKHLNVELNIVTVNSSDMVRDIEKMVEQMDEPIADPAALNVLYISQLARSQGIKVLLSGAGGDDLFTGYRRHRAVNLERYWSWLPMEIRKNIENITSEFDQRNTLFRRVSKIFSGASLNGDDRLINYFRWSKEADLINLFTAEAREVLGVNNVDQPMLEFLEKFPARAKPLDRMLALEQRFFLADHNLTYTDRMSMAAGVEVRVPFLDLDLVNFSAQIPIKLKQYGAEGKWVLKKAMEPYLPHEIIYRSKSGFGAPLRNWMRSDLREMLGDLLSAESLRRRGMFDPTAVQMMINNNDLGKTDSSYTLFSLLCIEIWCRRFIDKPENFRNLNT